MQSLSHSRSLEIVLDKQLYQLSTISKMKMFRAPEMLKKVVTAFKSKTDALRTKFVVLAAFRRRMTMVSTISHRIHALVSSDREKQARLLKYSNKTLVLRMAATGLQEPADDDDNEHDGVVDLSEVVMFEEDDQGYPDWTHSLFNGDNYYNDDEDGEGHDDHGVLDTLNEPQEVEGLEFNMDDEIDRACDMFIRRFRKRMNRRF